MGNQVIQVVGYQNSGKTTLIEKIISHLQQKGIRVGVLKHHGHGGTPDFNWNKDNVRHFNAGATVAMVEGDDTVQIVGELPEIGIEKKIALLQQFEVDLVIVEGYKNLSYPKIVMIRQAEDIALLENSENINAVVYWSEARKNVLGFATNIPKFSIDNESVLELSDLIWPNVEI